MRDSRPDVRERHVIEREVAHVAVVVRVVAVATARADADGHVLEVSVLEHVAVVVVGGRASTVGERESESGSTADAADSVAVRGVARDGQLVARSGDVDTLAVTEQDLDARLDREICRDADVVAARYDADRTHLVVPYGGRGDVRVDVHSGALERHHLGADAALGLAVVVAVVCAIGSEPGSDVYLVDVRTRVGQLRPVVVVPTRRAVVGDHLLHSVAVGGLGVGERHVAVAPCVDLSGRVTAVCGSEPFEVEARRDVDHRLALIVVVVPVIHAVEDIRHTVGCARVFRVVVVQLGHTGGHPLVAVVVAVSGDAVVVVELVHLIDVSRSSRLQSGTDSGPATLLVADALPVVVWVAVRVVEQFDLIGHVVHPHLIVTQVRDVVAVHVVPFDGEYLRRLANPIREGAGVLPVVLVVLHVDGVLH